MTVDPKPHRAHLLLVEVIIGVVLLSVAGFFLVRSMREARHRAEQRFRQQLVAEMSAALNGEDEKLVLQLAKHHPELRNIRSKIINDPSTTYVRESDDHKGYERWNGVSGRFVFESYVLIYQGETPLHWAAWRNDKAVAEGLLANGADVNAKTACGETPLDWATVNNAKDVAALLLSKGASPNPKRNNGMTPLVIAIRLKRDDIADLLRKHGAKD